MRAEREVDMDAYIRAAWKEVLAGSVELASGWALYG